MKQKYCLKCFLEFREVVKVIDQQKIDNRWKRESGKPEYRCIKRSHVLKAAGLSKPELKELMKFHEVKV